MLDFLLDLIFPKRCVSCGKWGKFLCENCLLKIEYFDPPAGGQVCPYCERPSPYGFTHPRCAKTFGLDGMFVLAHYRGPIRRAIQEIKYHGAYGVTSELVGQLVSKYHYQYHFDYLVPIPLHPKREQERGFNQAEKIAQELYKVLCIKYYGHREKDQFSVVRLLKRTRETKPQFDLKYRERKENVKNAFVLAHKYPVSSVRSASFCLVDDVATTGATIFECAKVLKRAGAKRVWAICIARGG